MVLPMFCKLPEVPVCSLDSLPQEGYAAVLTLERNDEAQLLELSAIMKDHLVVQEAWKEILPESPLLISSAICGGDIRERFREAATQRPCVLLLEPIKNQFPLPCLNGYGEAMAELPQGRHFYSDALCCYYTHTPTAMMLWDTDETMKNKIQLAANAGFLGVTEQK